MSADTINGLRALRPDMDLISLYTCLWTGFGVAQDMAFIFFLSQPVHKNTISKGGLANFLDTLGRLDGTEIALGDLPYR